MTAIGEEQARMAGWWWQRHGRWPRPLATGTTISARWRPS